MIEINSMLDLKPYVRYIPAKYTNGYCSQILFEIKNNNKLEDITINCDLELSFETISIFNLIETFEHDVDAQDYEIKLIANDIYAKRQLSCEIVECTSLIFDDNVSLTFLTCYGDVKGKRIVSNDILCVNLRADFASCYFISANNVFANTFHCRGVKFTNVTFHEPNFAEGVIKDWKGVQLDKIKFQHYNDIPF